MVAVENAASQCSGAASGYVPYQRVRIGSGQHVEVAAYPDGVFSQVPGEATGGVLGFEKGFSIRFEKKLQENELFA